MIRSHLAAPLRASVVLLTALAAPLPTQAQAQTQTRCNSATNTCTVLTPSNHPDPLVAAQRNSDAIEAVIKQAETGGFGHIAFPSGTFLISRSIQFNAERYRLAVRGAGVGKTIIQPVAAVAASYSPGDRSPLFPAFNISRPDTKPFREMQFELRGFTIDMDQFRNHPVYLLSFINTGVHGVRVGQGWGISDPDGTMLLQDLNIEGPPGYGIGIQTRNACREPADNLVIENVTIFRTGSDGFDSKEGCFVDAYGQEVRRWPVNLTMRGVHVEDFGLNEKTQGDTNTAANGVDIRYNGVYLEKVTVIGTGTVVAAHSQHSTAAPNFLNRTNTNGITFRPGALGGLKQAGYTATLRDIHVRGTRIGLMLGDNRIANVIVTNFLFEDYTHAGIRVAGKGHAIEHGCILPGEEGSQPLLLAPDAAGDASLELSYHAGAFDAALCPGVTAIGYRAFRE